MAPGTCFFPPVTYLTLGTRGSGYLFSFSVHIDLGLFLLHQHTSNAWFPPLSTLFCSEYSPFRREGIVCCRRTAPVAERCCEDPV